MKKQSKMLASQEFAVFCFTLAVVLAFVLLSTSFCDSCKFLPDSIAGLHKWNLCDRRFYGRIPWRHRSIVWCDFGLMRFLLRNVCEHGNSCIFLHFDEYGYRRAMWSVQWCIGRKIKNSADHCHNGFHEHFSRHRDCCNERRLDHRLSKILQYIGPRQNLWYSDPILDICSHHSLLRYSDEIFQYRPENICGRRQY